ncbi:MAG TPA: hypothetical protein VJB06_01080 [archaeon]|nr:hypothetical protein [archaeon]
MGNNYRLYGPSDEELRVLPIGSHYGEIWRGLPDVEFREERARNGELGLTYDEGGNYIWITPPAARAVKQNPYTFLLSMMKKTARGMHAWSVESCDPDVEIMRVKVFNQRR